MSEQDNTNLPPAPPVPVPPADPELPQGALPTPPPPDIFSVLATLRQSGVTAAERTLPHGETHTHGSLSWGNSPEELIADAREAYARIRSGGEGISIDAYLVNSLLERAGVGLEALDPRGQRSAEVFQREINSRLERSDLEEARGYFRDLRNGASPAGAGVDVMLMQSRMERHGFTADDLLPWLERALTSDAGAERKLNNVMNNAFIGQAFETADRMNQPSNDESGRSIDAFLAGSALKRAGINADTDGDNRTSVDEVNAALSNLTRPQVRGGGRGE